MLCLPRDALAAQENCLFPGSSCCKGSCRLGKARCTTKREKRESLRAWTIQPQVSVGQEVAGCGAFQASWSLFLTAQIWHQLTAALRQDPYWLESLKQTGRRKWLFLSESSLCSASFKQGRETGSYALSSGNYHRPESCAYLWLLAHIWVV